MRWADDLGRPPTAQETGLPGTRVPYRAIQGAAFLSGTPRRARSSAGALAEPSPLNASVSVNT